MTAGFQILNDANVVQVDGDFKNFALHSKQIISVSTLQQSSGTFGNVYRGTVSVPTDRPCVIAVQSAIAPVGVGPSPSAGSVYLLSKSSTSATAYVFCEPGTSVSTSGLQVFDAAGALAFDSEAKYMRVAYGGNIPNRTTPTYTPYSLASLASGSYAVVQSHSREYATLTSQPGLGLTLVRFRDFYLTTTTGFSVSNAPAYIAPGQDGATYSVSDFWALAGSSVVVIDVSGL